MKSVKHPDGLRRINMKVEVSVAVKDLTAYALDMVRDQPDPVEIITQANKREIFALARESIQTRGRDTALAEIPKIIPLDQLQRAEQHVRGVFPEID
jgi:hypothetical protein